MSDRSLVVRIIGDSSSLERSFARSSKATKQFDRDFSHASRGLLAGSGVFRSLGRSLAFASGGFLAFGSAAAFLRKSVDAAKEAQVANQQLAVQLTNSGKSFEEYRSQIDQTVSRLSALAGIEDDELKQGLTTILRTVPDVSKALRDLGTATDLARARHISLAQAAIIIAKTEAGNTTLLRRQGFQIAKNATAEQALAKVRAVVAGQAAAGTTQQERFGAVLHQTEEIIGTGILPTLNKYLESGSKWLQQMNESGKLQKDVAAAAHDFEQAIHGVAEVVKTVDKITGSFKNTLELLLGIKVASTLLKWAAAMNLFAAAETRASQSAVVSRINAYTGAVSGTGAAAATSTKQVSGLRGALSGLGLIQIAPILIPIEIALSKRAHDFLAKFGRAGSAAQVLLDIGTGSVSGNVLSDAKDALLGKKTTVLSPKFEINPTITNTGKVQTKFPLLKDLLAPIGGAGGGGDGSALTAAQKNTFFDNVIARILLRGGLGDINAQIAALEKADALIKQRLAVTKDVTRRLNLEDELLQNQAQIKDLKAQAVSDALAQKEQARQDALDAIQKRRQAAIEAAQKRAEARAKALAKLTSRQFRELGLSGTGDEVTPGVANLKKRLGQLTANLTGSGLDTPKLRSELARFRKVLSEGLVPKDVRAKIKEMMDAISDELKSSSRSGNVTKFAHANSEAILQGLGLTADQVRALRGRISQLGAGGTVPGVRSLAFAGGTTVVHTTVNLDGEKVARNTTKHQQRHTRRRSESRRGPYAGRN